MTVFSKLLLDHIISYAVNSLFYLHIIALMISLIRMIMIELRMFCYNFAYTIMSDILCKTIKTNLLFHEKSTNY